MPLGAAILTMFTLECALRFYAWRLNMFTNWLDAADVVVRVRVRVWVRVRVRE